METHRNGFMPCLNQPHYRQCNTRIPPHPPSDIILPRDLAQVNRSPNRHMVRGMNPQCSNVNLMPQPVVVGSMVPPMYSAAPRLAAPIVPHMPPQAYYAYPTRPAHFANKRYESSPANNGNLSPKMFGNDYRPPHETPAPVQSRWIKPTIFYDGFWTEQKVKKWISEQFIEESSLASSSVDNKARHINRAH